MRLPRASRGARFSGAPIGCIVRLMRRARPILARLALALALPLTLAAAPAAACSPEPGFHTPTNLALATQAPTIVLAQVVAGALDEGGDPFKSTITIRPIEALKGPLPDGDIALAGMMLSRDAGPELGMVSSPYEFERAHPVSYIGACTRFVFPLGTTALFFLRIDHEGRWAPAGEAFSRWAEDVPGRDAPWVELVRLYVRAAALPEGERTALLETERTALLARTDDPVAQLMAADVARQLAPQQSDAYALLDDAPPATVESSVEAALRKMRQASIEAGN